jgi:hypothetical protein
MRLRRLEISGILGKRRISFYGASAFYKGYIQSLAAGLRFTLSNKANWPSPKLHSCCIDSYDDVQSQINQP